MPIQLNTTGKGILRQPTSDGFPQQAPVGSSYPTHPIIAGTQPPPNVHPFGQPQQTSPPIMLNPPTSYPIFTSPIIIERPVPYEVEKYVHVQVPVQTYVQVPVDRIVEVPVYIDRVVPMDRPVIVPVQQPTKSVGVGLSLERADGDKATYVERVVRGFAAEKSGRIEVGDEVVTINDVDVRDLSIGSIKQLTVGPEGSWVKMDMLRGAFPYTVSLQRQLPSHTTMDNADAAGVLIHAGAVQPPVGIPPPDGRTVRLSPQYPRQSARPSLSLPSLFPVPA